ncbi:MAG: hypothetical protein V4467_03770 [Patescibacteria group bacterium]
MKKLERAWLIAFWVFVALPLIFSGGLGWYSFTVGGKGIIRGKFWLPAHCQIFTDSREFDKSLPADGYHVEMPPETYKDALVNEFHLISIGQKHIRHASIHGKIILHAYEAGESYRMRLTDNLIRPRILESVYLGNGEVEWKIERDWWNILEACFFGALSGVGVDALLILLLSVSHTFFN